MNPYDIIDKYYDKGTKLREILVTHSESVARKALEIVDRHPELEADRDFVWEAAMLHDIGIFLTDAPGIECKGSEPYISHGYLGADLMRMEGFPRHALVCERHTGVGISADELEAHSLPLPKGRIYLPLTIEEQIVCFADKFFSKSHLDREKDLEKARRSISRFGGESLLRFDEWVDKFI